MILHFSVCFPMQALLDCLWPQDEPLFEQFTQEEFDLLKAIEHNELVSVSETDLTYHTPETLEERRYARASLSMAVAVLERIRREKNARFFPKEQFHVYLALKYGNNKAQLLKNGLHHQLLVNSIVHDADS